MQGICLTHSSTLFFEAGPLSQSQIFLISCTLTRVIWGFPHLYLLRLEFQMGSHTSWALGWVLSIWALALLLFRCGAFSLALDS